MTKVGELVTGLGKYQALRKNPTRWFGGCITTRISICTLTPWCCCVFDNPPGVVKLQNAAATNTPQSIYKWFNMTEVRTFISLMCLE